jgi:predicted secreted protein with PEFG-CTERM motif
LKFFDAGTGDEIANPSYSIMLFKGGQHLNESHREGQTAAQQTYTFDEVGSYILRIENINGSGVEDGIEIPMQVTPEFPSVVMMLLIMAAMSTIILTNRTIKKKGLGV